jgi:hypothetical protein
VAPLVALAACLILGQAIFEELDSATQDRISTWFFFLATVLLWASMIHASSRKKQGGSLVVDLGQPNRIGRRHALALAFVLLEMFLAGRAILGWAATGFHSVRGLGETSMWVTGTVLWLDLWQSRNQIRERGFVSLAELVEWERIVAYEWIGAEGGQLLLRVRRHVPLLEEKIGLLVMTVPSDDKAAVSRLLAHHLPDRDQTGAGA